MKPLKINELLKTAAPRRDMEWLKQSLQYAIQLEFFTIPPYLTAFWSVKNHRDPAAVAIREVLVEEMLHMSLVCNMLKAIGGVPRICHPDIVPTYPNAMPGGVKPGLRVALEGLSKHTLKVFMEIEEPEKDVSRLEAAVETYPRIGVLYNAILDAFKRNQPTFSRGGQIEGYFGETRRSDGSDTPKNIGSLEEVEAAIDLIKGQGEGTSQSPFGERDGELAHYYRFKEIAVGKKIIKSPDGDWVHAGDSIEFPECWPVAAVPEGGYRDSGVPTVTWSLMVQFDEIYTSVLWQLDHAWNFGKQGAFHKALELMMDKLPCIAREIMQVPIRHEPYHYAPSFRLLEQ